MDLPQQLTTSYRGSGTRANMELSQVGLAPWEADRPLTVELARTAIERCFPTVDARRLGHLGSGWEFDTLSSADGWAFRFPRRAEYARLFEPERSVHDLVARVLPSGVAVPTVELMGHPTAGFPYEFGGHRCIPGVGADAVDPKLLPRLARDLGPALTSLHAVSEAETRAAGVVAPEADDADRSKWLRRRLSVADELNGLDADVDRALGWARRSTFPDPRYEGPLRFIHNDLSPEHLLVDPRTGRLQGIIDWTDAELGDPAADFVAIVTSLGWDFAREASRHYAAPIDAGFWTRLRFGARLSPVLWLAEAHEQGSDTAKHIEWIRNAFAGGPSRPASA